MADIDEFVSSPSHELLNGCTKEQLLSIAEHYEIVIKDKRLKENVKTALKIELIKQGILDIEMEEKDVPIAPDLKSNLSFEQQKELLLLQMDHENIKLRAEQGKRELEKAKLDLEFLKLNLVKEGIFVGVPVFMGRGVTTPAVGLECCCWYLSPLIASNGLIASMETPVTLDA
ncbi:uncharacterized protein LOC120489683 isoform X3 [Pimephales promelas]|uniref:uncharacterized protein LOC120483197 isoform X2 n=1 Tax=Pimephales promelas TaxID=90988 RepID=UPI001955D862|nr:uncharacterized protein LOC120483197 isoform X2 [Pimephales promelas]XP_039542156.1 uncharacterized protein LOC120489424 isoform X3 [Pimephales promelas]XP_039542616.1 uncharacterized protein LOC120489683 isoform X3 [Pimephales promelas]